MNALGFSAGHRHPGAPTCTMGLEGIVSKRVDARYRSGISTTWLSRRTRQARRCGGNVRRNGANLSVPKPSLGNRGANARQRVSDMWSPAGRRKPCICYDSPPPQGLAHLPTQFAARSSHRMPFASAAELKSTPVPMRLIAKKRCRVMVEPPEKGPVICSSCLPRSPRGQQDAENDSGDPATSMLEVRSLMPCAILTAVERRR